jgi:hypothetical protein
MRRTEMLQEIRRMRFEEVYFGWSENRLTQGEGRLYVPRRQDKQELPRTRMACRDDAHTSRTGESRWCVTTAFETLLGNSVHLVILTSIPNHHPRTCRC